MLLRLSKSGRFVSLNHLSPDVRELYEVHEWRHACAILKYDFAEEYEDIVTVLLKFRLLENDVKAPGGGKSKIPQKLDAQFMKMGWKETSFQTSASVNERILASPTHKVDLFKSRIALEVEWNNKDPFFDRDLDNFRHLFTLDVVSVGVIVTRADHLQLIFNKLGKGQSYGASTTHMAKLLPRIDRGGGGGCPILVFGITERLYVTDEEA